MLRNRGYTIVELIVVMAIFVSLMLATTGIFENIISKGKQQVKSVETNTEGIVGLEMLRSDLEHAGFGLPWAFAVTLATPFPETANTADYPVKGVTASSFNEITPRAIQVGFTPSVGKILDGGANNTNPGVSYLVIKSTRVALNTTAAKWAYVNYSAQSGGAYVNKSYIKKWGSPIDNFIQGERVITLSSTFTTTGLPNKILAMVDATHYFYPTTGSTPENPPSDTYKPGDNSQIYAVYGVDPGNDLRMPYNRADYYIKKPSPSDTNQFSFPQSCNPGTGILFKGVVQHADGTFTNSEFPLLSCVGDMQMEFELDPGNNGNIAISSVLPGTAADIRGQLKTVRVYILAHEGQKDRNYSYPNNSIQVGDPSRASSGRTWDGSATCVGNNCMQTVFGADWRNYRWKVYTIAVQPKNLD